MNDTNQSFANEKGEVARQQLEREKPFKWGWMMRYCELHRIPPAEEWAWNRAELAFIHAHGKQ